MRRTKADAEKTKAMILNSALILFDEQGFTATTLGAIAEKAGVTRGAIYWHFDDKIDIFTALGVRYMTLFINKMQQALSGHNTWLALGDAFEDLFTCDDEQIRFIRIVITQQEQDPIDTLSRHYHDTWKALINRAIDQAIARGELSEHTDRLRAFVHLSVAMRGVVTILAKEHDQQLHQAMQRYAGDVIRSSLEGIRLHG